MKYCELLLMDAIFSKPYYPNDREIVLYLISKLCSQNSCRDGDGDDNDRHGDSILSQATFEQWLKHKKSTSRDAKTRERLLTKKYRGFMQSCVNSWAVLFYHPNIAMTLDASRNKRLWLRNKESSLAKFWFNNADFDNRESFFGIAKDPRYNVCVRAFVMSIYLLHCLFRPIA
jgi:hypothetical protein